MCVNYKYSIWKMLVLIYNNNNNKYCNYQKENLANRNESCSYRLYSDLEMISSVAGTFCWVFFFSLYDFPGLSRHSVANPDHSARHCSTTLRLLSPLWGCSERNGAIFGTSWRAWRAAELSDKLHPGRRRSGRRVRRLVWNVVEKKTTTNKLAFALRQTAVMSWFRWSLVKQKGSDYESRLPVPSSDNDLLIFISLRNKASAEAVKSSSLKILSAPHHVLAGDVSKLSGL